MLINEKIKFNFVKYILCVYKKLFSVLRIEWSSYKIIMSNFVKFNLLLFVTLLIRFFVCNYLLASCARVFFLLQKLMNLKNIKLKQQNKKKKRVNIKVLNNKCAQDECIFYYWRRCTYKAICAGKPPQCSKFIARWSMVSWWANNNI